MTNELPPIEFLDAAARLSGRGGWDASDSPFHSQRLVKAIIAHARTLEHLAKYEPPVDPAELQRRQGAREAAAVYWDAIGEDTLAKLARSGECDADGDVQSAYIALCHRDKTTPIPVEQWGEGK